MRSILAISFSLATVLAFTACSEPDLPSDDATPTPIAASSPTPVATPAGRTIVLIDAPVALSGLSATVESAYEIGHPDVDLVVALHDDLEMQARLFDTEPADIFLVDAATGADRATTAVSTNDPLGFSMEYVALLADRSAVGGPVLSFLSWLMGPDGRAIVATAGLTPPS
jgi:hypothetical protein